MTVSMCYTAQKPYTIFITQKTGQWTLDDLLERNIASTRTHHSSTEIHHCSNKTSHSITKTHHNITKTQHSITKTHHNLLFYKFRHKPLTKHSPLKTLRTETLKRTFFY